MTVLLRQLAISVTQTQLMCFTSTLVYWWSLLDSITIQEQPGLAVQPVQLVMFWQITVLPALGLSLWMEISVQVRVLLARSYSPIFAWLVCLLARHVWELLLTALPALSLSLRCISSTEDARLHVPTTLSRILPALSASYAQPHPTARLVSAQYRARLA